jgi:glycosyltransferase involved in cell wall biosynthesis
MIINIIQDIATPHNNILLNAFKENSNIKINLWYAIDKDQNKYNWKKNLNNEVFIAKIYGNKLNLSFLKYCILNKNEFFLIVGWMNINTIVLHFLFFILRRPYNHWTDLPSYEIKKKSLLKLIFRKIAYYVLKNSKSKIFCVGITTINKLKDYGFDRNRLYNLPIFIEVYNDLSFLKNKNEFIFNDLVINKNKFIISMGSRLVYDKGYDIVIKAINLLNKTIVKNIEVLIVGSGIELNNLINLRDQYKLTETIKFINWLSIEDFKTLIASSNIFIHPARVDSYGGTILAMSLGVPVIGSTGAGAAVDRIINGVNGFLYETENIKILSKNIELLFFNAKLRENMSTNAHNESLKWPPSLGAKILIDNLI